MTTSRLKHKIIQYHRFRNKSFYWFVGGFLFLIALATAIDLRFNFAILGILVGIAIYMPETLMHKFRKQAYKTRLGLYYPKMRMPNFLYHMHRVAKYLVLPAVAGLIYMFLTYPVFNWAVMLIATICWIICYVYLLSMILFPIVGNVLKVIVDDQALTVFWEGASSDENIFEFPYATTKYKLLNNVLWMSSPDTFRGRMFDLDLSTFSEENRSAIIAGIKNHKEIRVIRESQLRLAL